MKLVQALTRGLEDVAHVDPWTTSFNSGTTPLTRLLDLAREVDFAVGLSAAFSACAEPPYCMRAFEASDRSPRIDVRTIRRSDKRCRDEDHQPEASKGDRERGPRRTALRACGSRRRVFYGPFGLARGREGADVRCLSARRSGGFGHPGRKRRSPVRGADRRAAGALKVDRERLKSGVRHSFAHHGTRPPAALPVLMGAVLASCHERALDRSERRCRITSHDIPSAKDIQHSL